ncbi:MAG: YraN family protein [Clostridia bacterium]|nr:YraN family protein [Clostridia bacterium]
MRILELLTERRRIGNVGERAAAKYLRRHGYKILRRNYVACGAEIDIIADDGIHTAFVEVKTRTLGREDPREPRPASAVTPEKQRKIISTAKFFRGEYFERRRMRFDIIEVFLDEKKKVVRINHLESAFNADTAHRM